MLTADVSATITLKKPVAIGERYAISSEYVEHPPEFNVYLPSDYHLTAEHVRYPVVIVLDGHILANGTQGMISHLGDTGAMPRSIVVAIDTSNDTFGWGPKLYNINTGWSDKKGEPMDFTQGGEKKYTAFMQKELLPFLDKTFRTNQFRILVGMSPSATFVLHTVWNSPGLFNAHIVFAALDVLGMGYTPDTSFIDKIEQHLKTHPQQKGHLYVSSRGNSRPAKKENMTIANQKLTRFVQQGFHFKAEFTDDLDIKFHHYAAALQGLDRALAMVFPRQSLTMNGKFFHLASTSDNPLKDIKEYFDALSEQWGFKVIANLDLTRNSACIRSQVYRLRSAGKLQAASELYQYWVDHAPKSPLAWAGYARTMMVMDKPEQAMAYYQNALKYKEFAQPWLIEIINNRISELKASQ